MSEKVIVNCRLCGKPMNVPKSIMMVFTFDPTVCVTCRDRVPDGDWETEQRPREQRKPTSCIERLRQIRERSTT